METKNQLNAIIQNPANLSLGDSTLLSQTIKKHPYFQAARAIQLKALKIQNSFSYNQQLKVTAAHTADRGVLFDFITSETFNDNNVSMPVPSGEENTPFTASNITTEHIRKTETKAETHTETLPTTEENLNLSSEDADRIVDPQLFEAKSNSTNLETKEDFTTLSEDATTLKELEAESEENVNLQVNAPLTFDKNERHSFSEWLRLAAISPIQRNDEVSIKTPPIVKKEKKLIESPLIDDFIKTNPRISPVDRNAPKINLAAQQNAPAESLMTETLAKVYLAQHNYKKAIQAYKILSLKNPEKSGLFADQIRAIEKLMQNK